MITLTPERAAQLELDFEVDSARLEKQEWQRAQSENLRALLDYVDQSQLIIWQPGDGGQHGARAFDVQVSSTTACTCQRYRLLGRCQHVAFAARLEHMGHTVTTDTPLSAREI